MGTPPVSWASAPYAAALLLFLVSYFIIYPFVEYIRDPKGLRRFPNFSPLSGISSIPFVILAHSGDRSRRLAKLHKDQPILRTGPNTLSFGTVRAIKDIYGHGTPCTKDESYVLGAGTHYHLADVVDKGDHARKRKVLSSAYALKNLDSWEYKVADKEGLPPAPEELNIDYRMWTNFFALDAIADIGLSERLGFLDQGTDRVVAQRKDGSTYETNLRECLYPTARKQSLLIWSYDWYKLVDRLADVVPFYRRMTASSRGWDDIILGRGSRRLKRYRAGEKLDDFFQALMEDMAGSPNLLERGEILAEVNIMMNAGSVTTAIAIANVTYQLLKNPACLRRLREELDSVLDPDKVVAPYDKVRHLPYLRACLDESLRLFPPTPHGLPRATPPEGTTIMGEWIAGDTTVSISAMVAHRDESVFYEPEKYIPDRWLGDKGKELQPSFITFSAGARGCIGRNISYLEQTVCVASILHRFDMALAPRFEIERLETMNHILGPIPVKMWRRQLGVEHE
ncbi:hypothetical protein diail_5537 [Diaporthe ilicicola]|nr:hypothetical protein diail_5537 [Diaporthe ilicicola]